MLKLKTVSYEGTELRLHRATQTADISFSAPKRSEILALKELA